MKGIEEEGRGGEEEHLPTSIALVAAVVSIVSKEVLYQGRVREERERERNLSWYENMEIVLEDRNVGSYFRV